MSGQLRVGVERVPVTPPIGIRQCGYAARDLGSTHLLDDLYATAMVCDNGETQIALVACDLIFVHPITVACVRDEVARRAHIPHDHVMLCCSHTHSGPITYAGPEQGEREHAYITTLAYQIAGAICAAQTRLQPARIGYGQGNASIGVNRREQHPNGQVILGENRAGPVDPTVSIVRIDALEGAPLAVLVNYACHAVALSAESYGLSADWPGAMRRVVEAETGARCLFIQGAGADINPRGGPSRDYGRMQRLGQSVAGGVIQAWADIQDLREDMALGGVTEQVWVPLQEADGQSAATLQESLVSALKLPWEKVLQMRAERFPWSVEVAERDSVRHAPIATQALRLGEAAIAAIGAEPFVEVGLAVKARSPYPHTLVAGYANGSIGYLPTAEAYAIGGYEVGQAYFWYHLPAMIAPTAARMVEDRVTALLEQTKG